MFGNLYKNTRILITGHTGFKGSWLVLWLLNLGASVVGYSLDAPTDPNHHEILDLDIGTVIGNINDLGKLQKTIDTFQPNIVFHMAAQSLVRQSYINPVETFETNVIGTVNLLEACRYTDSVKAILIITSDKCYDNREWVWGYRENDPVGGYDPYSASKGCAELVTASYRKSFFPPDEYHKSHQTLVASVRAGNVVGGGDWGEDRLVPDIIRAAIQNKKTDIRNPYATRPWQHVLEPLSGYLLLGQQLLEEKKEFSGAWNFGPYAEDHRDVLSVVKELQCHWERIDYQIVPDETNSHEANSLKLDCSKVHVNLNWQPVWNSSITFGKVVKWYREFYESDRVLSKDQLFEYIKEAKQKKIHWAIS
jgi:CDP-glucose 4,6-dehydratase